MQSDSLAELLGVQPAGLADHREQPSSTALSSVVGLQNASPSGMVASGVTCSAYSTAVGLSG
jgi:hypothetical protein